MEKVKNLYEELSEKKKNLIEWFDVQKAELVEFINQSNYQKILEIETYNIHKNIMSTVQQINEIDIKLRTLRYILKEGE
jgi:hypothetical protein